MGPTTRRADRSRRSQMRMCGVPVLTGQWLRTSRDVLSEPGRDLVLRALAVGDRHHQLHDLRLLGPDLQAVEPQEHVHGEEADPFVAVDERM